MIDTSQDIPVPDNAGVYLGVSAGNYHDADLAFWKRRDELGPGPYSPGEAADLDQLRQRRKDTYADLVVWVTTIEAQRVAAEQRVDA